MEYASHIKSKKVKKKLIKNLIYTFLTTDNATGENIKKEKS